MKMSKAIKKISAKIPHTQEQSHGDFCFGCKAKDEIMAHQREMIRAIQAQNETLQNKLLSLVPDAMDKYHRYRLTELSQSKPLAMDSGILGDVEEGPEQEFLDGFMGQFKTFNQEQS